MSKPIQPSLAKIGLILSAFSLAGCGGAPREACITRAPNFTQGEAGYELLDFGRGEVWATTDWSPEQFYAFTLPWNWPLWRKNDPRVGLADRGHFLRSPGCEANGEFSYINAFGREFLHVVDLGDMNRLDAGARRVEVSKHHILEFDTGRTLTLLTDPMNEHFVCMTQSLDRPTEQARLPEGWRFTQIELQAPLTVELFGSVTVVRLSNEDSCQGPLSSNASF